MSITRVLIAIFGLIVLIVLVQTAVAIVGGW